MKQLSFLLWLACTEFSSALVASKKIPAYSKTQLVVLYIHSDKNNTDPKGIQLLQPTPGNIFKRDDNGGCGPVYSGLVAREVRTETLILIRRNASALDRRMELPDPLGRRPMPDFFHQEMPKWKPVVTIESATKPKDLSASTIQDLTNLGTRKDKAGNDVPVTEFSTGMAHLKGCTSLYIISHKGVFAAHYWENVSFASTIQDLTNLGTRKDKAGNDVPVTEFSTGMAHLKGCTSLYIISHKGVFAAHYWENVSFDPDDIWLTGGATEWTPEAKATMFKSTVLDPLKNGSKYHPKLSAKILDDEYIRAYIVRPYQTWKEEDGDVGYVDQWNQMKNMVGSIIPRLADESKWDYIRYQPVKNEDDLDSRYKASGKNIFKYDSQHPVAGTGTTQHKAALWVEDEIKPYYDQTW